MSGTLAIAVAGLNSGFKSGFDSGVEDNRLEIAESGETTPASAQAPVGAGPLAQSSAAVVGTAVGIEVPKPSPTPAYHIAPLFDRERALNDLGRRIPDDFLIPPGLLQRVGFWFDIYSRFDSTKRVIHHSLYPWVIYKVVDVSLIINSDYPKFRWQRNQLADRLVKAELAGVRQTLARLAKKKRSQLTDDRLSESEKQVRDALLVLGGDVRRRAKDAIRDTRVQMGQRNFFAEGLQTAPRYLPTMEEIFRKHRLPIELTRLPLVESSFNKHATSKVGAVGIWQFMESTGRGQKLVVNSLVDERKSPFKSTDAAARLLKENHLILGRSWELAVTAWNHGPAGIKRAARSVGSRDLSRIIEIYHSRSFDFASENFFSEFLAALYAERYSDEIFPGLPLQDPVSLETVTLSRKTKLSEILLAARMTAEDFANINPDLTKLLAAKRFLYKGLRIQVPSERKTAVEFLWATQPTAPQKPLRVIGANDSASPSFRVRQ